MMKDCAQDFMLADGLLQRIAQPGRIQWTVQAQQAGERGIRLAALLQPDPLLLRR